MPLLMSPIDGAPMRQIHRFGIEIDVCPTSGGIWLDKGELEKLIALIKEEAESERPSQRRGAVFGDDDHDSDDHHRHNEDRRSGRRKSRLSDIFDF